MVPLEKHEGDWEDNHEWLQNPDTAEMELTVSFICNRKHISILSFVSDNDRVYHSVDLYSTEELDGGLNVLLGSPEDDEDDEDISE